ncbi:hypothetical protein [Pseudomonas chlororaphis]|uniref:hypothetical protein n=1 Tax=Pseudomonas chlororaphis TaxID=587753 RepID=UPI0012D36E48|nr:hypothetical protein [Pseudomonas chlororaphis]
MKNHITDASDITSLFGTASDDERITLLFDALNTLRRPQRADLVDSKFYDWVLVRRLGVELGFVDEEYQSATSSFRWGYGKHILAQAYFYCGTNDILPFRGHLPVSLTFSDSRDETRAKLSSFETTRHSFISDAWDIENYRLTAIYKVNGTGIERIICRMLPNPIPRDVQMAYPDVERIPSTFGCTLQDLDFKTLWSDCFTDGDYSAAKEDGEIDLNKTFGVTLGFFNSVGGALFRSITFHRNRDQESAGWGGMLPQGLEFEDSPEVLFSKIPNAPVQKADSALTGYAVWHLRQYTLHVLYSNIDNRLLRVKMIAPGTWKCVEDFDE